MSHTTLDQDNPAWSIPHLREPRYSQSLERGLAILGCFTPKRRVLGIAELADELGMSRSTTHRYVITLVALGYLEQGAGRKYHLGLRVTDLGMSALNSTDLSGRARPYLEELRHHISYATGLYVLDGEDALCMIHLASLRRRKGTNGFRPQAGSRLPSFCTAPGKLLLAFLPDSERRELTGAIKLCKQGPNAITNKKALTQELKETREMRLAIDDEEFTQGHCAIAVPVLDENGEAVAAASVTAPTSAISAEEMVDALGPHLISTADRISARLGYRRPNEQEQQAA